MIYLLRQLARGLQEVIKPLGQREKTGERQLSARVVVDCRCPKAATHWPWVAGVADPKNPMVGRFAGWLTREARSADLVVIGQTKGWASKFEPLDPGAAILMMGRPVLVVPEGISSLGMEHVIIAWKDVREARRALQDVLPLLKKAARVTIFEACGPDEEKSALAALNDVVRKVQSPVRDIRPSAVKRSQFDL